MVIVLDSLSSSTASQLTPLSLMPCFTSSIHLVQGRHKGLCLPISDPLPSLVFFHHLSTKADVSSSLSSSVVIVSFLVLIFLILSLLVFTRTPLRCIISIACSLRWLLLVTVHVTPQCRCMGIKYTIHIVILHSFGTCLFRMISFTMLQNLELCILLTVFWQSHVWVGITGQ